MRARLQKRGIRIAAMVLAAVLVLLLAAPVLAVVYRAAFVVTEANGNAYAEQPVTVLSDNQWLADNGFMEDDALDSRVETLGGLELPHMVVDDRIWTVTNIAATSNTNLYFSTGNTDLTDTDIIAGGHGDYSAGYITTSDIPALEDGTQFEHETTCYLETDYREYYTYLQFTSANSDWVSIPDSAAMDFTDGAGTDEAGSIVAWINVSDLTPGVYMFNHGPSVANQYNFSFSIASTGKPVFALYNNTGAAYISRTADAQAVYEGRWHQVAVTYDGSEASTGIILYVDGEVVASTGADNGYSGTHDSTQVYETGSRSAGTLNFLDGNIGELSFYTDVLTPAEILADYNDTHESGSLEAWWKIDELTGNPADSSGNGHNATANLADWYTEKSPFQKTGAIFCYLSADDTWSLLVPGVVGLDVTVATAAELILTASSAGGTATLDITGCTPDSGAIGIGVTDTTTDWIIGKVPYMDYYEHSTAATGYSQKIDYDPDSMIVGTTLPNELNPGTYDGTFTWGTNPTGVTITLGGMVSENQPAPFTTTAEPPRDVATVTNTSEWYNPDTTALASSPFYPIVDALASTSSFTEIQIWRILATGIIVMLVLGALVAIPGHLLAAGIACMAGTALAVGYNNIFPFWTLIVSGMILITTLIMERSPNV